jgi:hypothetical protein
MQLHPPIKEVHYKRGNLPADLYFAENKSAWKPPKPT